jgi:hypothetical protein
MVQKQAQPEKPAEKREQDKPKPTEKREKPKPIVPVLHPKKRVYKGKS